MSKILSQQLIDLQNEIAWLSKKISHQELQKKAAYVASTICSVLEQAKEHPNILQEHIPLLFSLKNNINNRIFNVFVHEKNLHEEFNNKIDKYISEYLKEISLIQDLEIMTDVWPDFKKENNQKSVLDQIFDYIKNLEAIQKLISEYEVQNMIQNKLLSFKKKIEPLVVKNYDNQLKSFNAILEDFEKIETDSNKTDLAEKKLKEMNTIIGYLENTVAMLPSQKEHQEIFEQLENIKAYIAMYNN